MPRETDDHCVYCGEFRRGRKTWMFRHHSLPAWEFVCRECRRKQGIYALVGLTLLFVLVACLSAAVIYLKK